MRLKKLKKIDLFLSTIVLIIAIGLSVYWIYVFFFAPTCFSEAICNSETGVCAFSDCPYPRPRTLFYNSRSIILVSLTILIFILAPATLFKKISAKWIFILFTLGMIIVGLGGLIDYITRSDPNVNLPEKKWNEVLTPSEETIIKK